MKKKKISLNYIIFIAITMVAVATILSFWFLCNRKFSGLIIERAVDDYAETIVAMQKNVDTLVSYTEDFAKYMSLDERVQSLLEEYNAIWPFRKCGISNMCSTRWYMMRGHLIL
ncbi:hypothetical protein [Ruminococcus sp. 5_1_39BFAA]|uniref:hypothetical protein n=1 Tax=Ruminococcus sp. 5_1_39BFAA TaxID=457412 RepID=UPI003568CBD6